MIAKRDLVLVAFAPAVLLAVATASLLMHGGVDRSLLACGPGIFAMAGWKIVRARAENRGWRLDAALVGATGLCAAAPWLVGRHDLAAYLYAGVMVIGLDGVLAARPAGQRRVLATATGLLAGASIYLTFVPPETPSIGPVPGYGFAPEPVRTPSDPRLDRAPGELDADFASRLNEVVFLGIAHGDPYVTPRDSWLIWLAARSPWSVETLGDAQDPGLILARGRGLCHQAAIVFADRARGGGLVAETLSLVGHVVTLVDGGTVYDPDYGLGGWPLASTEEQIEARYRERLEPWLGSGKGQELARVIAGMYASPDILAGGYENPGPKDAAAMQRHLLHAQVLIALSVLAASVRRGWSAARPSRPSRA